jgi:galactosylceramidase
MVIPSVCVWSALWAGSFGVVSAQQQGVPTVALRGDADGRTFDGIGVVDGGGATSVLLKDYPEPQRSQILDLIYKPKFGASVGALLVEIPGDGNSTQGSMPSHMRTRDDLNYHRGYEWWIVQQAKKRNPNLTLTGLTWSAPGWIGNGNLWSQDAADYETKWLEGLKDVYGITPNAIGMRNEKGVNFDYAKKMRTTLDRNGFQSVKLQGFDNWPKDKLEFVEQMLTDPDKRNAVDILSAHTLVEVPPTDWEKLRQWSDELKKPLWNSEEHVYKDGFDCAISIVQAFNRNYIRYGATLVVNWYGIGGVYPLEPYSEKPVAVLARSPWSGAYTVRESLWGYAHYGQFTEPGWRYLDNGYGELKDGGSFVTLKSPGKDYSIIAETKDATATQSVRFEVSHGLSENALHVWRSNEKEQFMQQEDVKPVDGVFTIVLEPNSIYSLTTTTGQRKGSFANVPLEKPFPFPYRETFEEYRSPKDYGYLPRYTADIEEVFEIVERPDHKGKALRQVIPEPTISWAPDWKPYTILGDEHWSDYEISADVSLNTGDSAGVMGRLHSVDSGFGTIPQGYFLELAQNGECRLVAVRGKKDKAKLVGDAEQQALIKKSNDASPGGEMVLASKQLPGVAAGSWHKLTLRFEGSQITGFVDDKQVLSATDSLYLTGMAGLLAGREGNRLSTPYFDNLIIGAPGAKVPSVAASSPLSTPIYRDDH